MSIKLTGITWDHTRGYAPMPATAQAYHKEHPGVEIVWEKRTLHDFGAFDVEQLAQRFDLVVLDHPWAGFMAARKCYIPLEQYVSKEAMDDLARNTVGPSHRSYEWAGHQWAFAIDASTPRRRWRDIGRICWRRSAKRCRIRGMICSTSRARRETRRWR
jgi:multiple sugar transport system substrate-binding protein